MADINGMWLGTYWQEGAPTRFEATLIQGGTALSGRIMDDNHLGEAQISGEVMGRSVRFTKRYLTHSTHSVTYSGTLSEDEKTMQGDWVIGSRHSGTWEAHRNNEDLMAEFKTQIEKQEPALVGATEP